MSVNEDEMLGAVDDANISRQPGRYAILILGMHRSGTSALAGLLAKLGCDEPKTMMPATQMNPKGYFESDAIYRLHEEILASAGTSWDDFRPFPRSWLASPKAAEYRSRMQDLIRSEYGTSCLFVLKDPRICRLLPFWITLLEQMGIRPLAIHTHRNPLEVSRSLTERDQIDPDYGLFLWLCHVLSAEHDSRGLTRAFTSYEKLIGNWAKEIHRLGQELGISWPKLSRAIDSDIPSFIDPKLKRFHVQTSDLSMDGPYPRWIPQTFSILETWIEGAGQDTDRETLDATRIQYEISADALGSIVHNRGKAIRTDRDNVRKKLVDMENESEQRSQRIDTLTNQNTELRHDVESCNDQLTIKTSEIAHITAELSALSTHNARLNTEAIFHMRQIEAMTETSMQNQREIATLTHALSKGKDELKAANALRPQLHETRRALMKSHAMVASAMETLSDLSEKLPGPSTRDRLGDLLAVASGLARDVDNLLKAQVVANDELICTKAELDSLLLSPSWRFMAPLRWILRTTNNKARRRTS